MAINYGIHQDGDSYIINPRLVNGDGFIGIGPEVKVHIGAGQGDDTLITPKLQVTGGASVGQVMKSADSQGNAVWTEDVGFEPYDQKTVFASYVYEGLAVATESFSAGSSATLEHAPSNPAVNLRVYVGTTSDLTEEVPTENYTVTEQTITFTEALTSPFVVVYGYTSEIAVTDEPVNVVNNVLPLMHTVKAGSTFTLRNLPSTEQGSQAFVEGTDYSLSQDRNYIELIADGAIVGRTDERKFVTIDSTGAATLDTIGKPATAFVDGFPQTVWAEYDTFTRLTEDGTLDSSKSYTMSQATLTGDIVSVESVKVNDADAEFSFDAETKTVTVDSAAENDSVEVVFTVIRHFDGSTVNITDGAATLVVPSFGDSIVIAAHVAPDNESPDYVPNQDYEIGGDDEHTLILLDHPLPNQVLAYNPEGDALWLNIATLVENPDGLDLDGKVVIYRDGRLIFAESTAIVELESLVPEEGKQDSYILAWDGDQQKVVWKADNDSWPATLDSSTKSGQFLVSSISGDTHSASWTDSITLDADEDFSLTASGDGDINLASADHIDISTTGNGATAGIDIVASNGDDSNGSSIGVKAYDDVTLETVAGSVDISSGSNVTIAGNSSTTGNGGNVTVQAGDSSTGAGGTLTLKSGSGDTADGNLLLDTASLQLKGLAGAAQNMVLYIQNYDPATGIATLGLTTVDALVMTSGH